MVAKPGYKETDVGTIPDDWEVRRFADVASIVAGQVNPQVDPYRSMILVSPNHVESGTGRLLETSTAIDQGAISGKYVFKKGYIVYSKIRPNLRKAILADFAGLCSADMYPIIPANDVSPGFLLASILGQRFSRFAEDVSMRTGIPKINREDLAQFKFAVPPFREQEAIAEALSDADALIESLEQLIAKKRQIKQGAMQELLTGKKRLPGFSGEWVTKRLGDIGTFLKGSGIKKDESQSGDIPCMRYGEIYTHHNDVVTEFYSHISAQVALTAVRLKRGDILFAGSGETKEEIGKCVAFVDEVEAYAGGDIVILRSVGMDSTFLGYYLNIGPIARQKASKGQGDAVVHISSSALSAIDIKVPAREEQTAIAALLADMDAEIAAIETKLAKARQVKQGMMHNLLTGRIRLV